MLSPRDYAIVSATVLRYIDIPDDDNAMVLQVSRVFRGDVDSEEITVFGDDSSLFTSPVENFAIGSQWVFRLSGGASVYSLLPCTAGAMEIIDGEIEGYIRDQNRSCGGVYDITSPYCEFQWERMTLNEFDIAQQAYYSGIYDGVYACVTNRYELGGCPARGQFFLDTGELVLPAIDLYRNPSAARYDSSTPLTTLEAVLELLEGDGGSLLFNISRIQPVETLPAP